jgi:hypothetical protein
MTAVVLFCLVLVAAVAYVVRTAWLEHGYDDTPG